SRLRRTRAFASTALLITTGLAVVALVLRAQAINESQLANSRRLAADSLLQVASDPQLSLLLGVKSAQVRQTPEALDALRRALPANHLIRTLLPAGSHVPATDGAVSPDGNLIAVAAGKAVRVWTTSGRLLRTFIGHGALVQ